MLAGELVGRAAPAEVLLTDGVEEVLMSLAPVYVSGYMKQQACHRELVEIDGLVDGCSAVLERFNTLSERDLRLCGAAATPNVTLRVT